MINDTVSATTSPVDFSALDLLRDMAGPGAADPVAELCAVFVEEAQDRLRALGRALDRADAAGVRAAAHSLKGMAGALGAAGLSDLSHDIERRAAAGRLDVAALAADLEREFVRVRQAIAHLC